MKWFSFEALPPLNKEFLIRNKDYDFYYDVKKARLYICLASGLPNLIVDSGIGPLIINTFEFDDFEWSYEEDE